MTLFDTSTVSKVQTLTSGLYFFKEHNDGSYFFPHFFHIMLFRIVYLATFLIRKDGDFIFRFLKIVFKKKEKMTRTHTKS